MVHIIIEISKFEILVIINTINLICILNLNYNAIKYKRYIIYCKWHVHVFVRNVVCNIQPLAQIKENFNLYLLKTCVNTVCYRD
jgi:hypothetical protein